MYFGSVKFFKHLIVTIIFIIITALSVSTTLLYLDSNGKAQEIEKLNSDRNALQALYNFENNNSEYTADKINEILVLLKNMGINSKELVNTIYNSDRGAFDEVINLITASFDISAEDDEFASSQPPVSEEPVTPEEPLSPYAELFPHLYVDFTPPDSYIDDVNYIYLTFDDGPSQYTNDILRYLDKHNVKATFFVMPDDTLNGRNFLNTMLDSGHQIGVHTMTHVYTEIYSSVEGYLDDFSQAFNLIYEQTGYKPYLFRFPGGSKNDFNTNVRDDIIAEMTRRGFVYFDWNVDSRDALGANWTQMYNSVISDISDLNRAIVLFHDRPGGYNTVTVIEDIIKALIADPRGYVFSPILPETRPVQF